MKRNCFVEGGKVHHSMEKAKKPSPSRRASNASDAIPLLSSGGSKASTPARSPQHPPTIIDTTSQQSGSKGRARKLIPSFDDNS